MPIIPVEVAEIAKWLLDKGYAEERSGYGHVSAEDLAQALVDRFDIYKYAKG